MRGATLFSGGGRRTAPRYNCAVCGAQFKSSNPNPQYCSRKCKGFAQSAKLDADEVIRLYEQGMSQVEVAMVLNTTSTSIEKLFKRIDYKGRTPIKRSQTGAANDNWKGGRVLHSSGYVLVRHPNHPRAQNGYVLEHILVMEQHIGRTLVWYGNEDERTEIVHHKNENKQDNRIDNLEIVTPSEHGRIHRSKT